MEHLFQFWSQLASCWNSLPILGFSLTAFALLFVFIKRRRSWSHYPPGPPSLPFLGNMLQIDFYNPHLSFNQLNKKFGNVFSLQYFWSNMVVVNGYKAVKDALVQKAEDFADRPYFPKYAHLGYNKCSEGLVISRYGLAWREQRRFALCTLKNFGMGKKSLENQISQEAGYLCSAFSSKEGHPFDPPFLVKKAVSSVIYSLTFGERFDYDDEKFQRLVEIFQQSMKEESGFLPQLLNEVPFLLRIPGVPQKVFQYQRASMSLIDAILKKHKETWDSTHIRDFTDAFLQEMEKLALRPPPPPCTGQCYTCFSTLRFRDTVIITNLSSVLKDETFWEKPHQFYPEHFLDADGQFVKREAFLPFSAGRRICLGEQLARMELFLFFTSLLQCFTFQVPEDQPSPQEDGCFAIIHFPHPYQIQAILR